MKLNDTDACLKYVIYKLTARKIDINFIILPTYFILAAHQPWLFPSLGASAFFQAEQPEQKAARFYPSALHQFCLIR